jgi:AraC family transcriptional regulator of adaptative response / DNA-3-methyladenine glycosylase II
MLNDHERCYRAVLARDARFDGVFYTGVRTTGIYCRPSCPAVTPKPQNVTFYASAAAAQDAGFRACRRCRPDTTPGSPEWNVRADAVGRAMRLIGDGVVEREGVEGLASRLGYSQRHVNRMLTQELGAGPLALARSNRSHAARVLIETTSMPMSDIAFAAGFASIRQFNDSVRQVYAMTPTEMRGRRRSTPTGRVTLRLAVRQPFHADGLVEFLGPRAIEGVERVDGRTYARVLRLPHGLGVVQLTLHDDHVACELELADLRDTAVAVERSRRLLDLDADPFAIADVLSADPLLAPLVASAPGLRVPSQVDGFEVAVRAIVGQQVSVAGARTILGRFARAYGSPVTFDLAATHGLTHAFATAESLAEADETALSMPRARARALIGVAQAVADGKLELDPGADRVAVREALIALPGIGPWTADYLSMRALANPDVMLETDLIIRRMLDHHGVEPARTQRWTPWRSYAAMYLWRASADVERTPQ